MINKEIFGFDEGVGVCRGSGILWVSYLNQRTRTGFVGGEATSSQGMADIRLSASLSLESSPDDKALAPGAVVDVRCLLVGAAGTIIIRGI